MSPLHFFLTKVEKNSLLLLSSVKCVLSIIDLVYTPNNPFVRGYCTKSVDLFRSRGGGYNPRDLNKSTLIIFLTWVS